MVSAFGPRASDFAQRPGLTDLDAIVTDVSGLPSALLEAVRRRERGQPVYGMVLWEDRRSDAILSTAAQVLRQVPDPDARPTTLDHLCRGTLNIGGGNTSSSLWATLDDSVVTTCNEFFLLTDAALVRSYTEYLRLLPLFLRMPRVETIVAEPVVPAVARSVPQRPAVVVWAPNRNSESVAYHALALVEFRGDVTCVTFDGATLPESSARFVAAHGPGAGAALATATCIVCVEPDDPGAAVAFARQGYGIVAPLSSGAHEYVRDAVSFNYTTTRELQVAVSIAIAQPASLRELPKPPRSPVRPALPGPPETLPLVSVVTPTYNRRRDLRHVLGALARQTYPRIEVIVVNDGGENVDDLVARFPFARAINLDHVGVLRAVIAGVEAVRGDYIQLIADDDWLQPDHIESLVGAMLRSGAAVAHGNALIRHQEREPDGSFATTGFTTLVFNETTSPSAALVATSIAGNAMIVRRDILDEIGTWTADSILHDQEFHLRAAQSYVFAYVDRMTAEFRSRGKHQLSPTVDGAAELRRMYDELHPVTDRPIVQERRAAALAAVAGRTMYEGHVFPATYMVSPPIPEPAFDDGP